MGILDDGEKRQGLTELALADSQSSPLFARIAELGKEFEAGLLALLFDDPELRRWVREYLIFSLNCLVQTGTPVRIVRWPSTLRPRSKLPRRGSRSLIDSENSPQLGLPS